MRSRLVALALTACAAASACNAITDTGKYELVDCPSGSCGDAAGASSDAQSTAEGGSGTDASMGMDSGVVIPTCGSGSAALTLTVPGTSGSVTSNPGTVNVSAGHTQSVCVPVDTIVLRTNGPSATWTGTSCKDGQTGDRCEFPMPSTGLTMTAALP